MMRNRRVRGILDSIRTLFVSLEALACLVGAVCFVAAPEFASRVGRYCVRPDASFVKVIGQVVPWVFLCVAGIVVQICRMHYSSSLAKDGDGAEAELGDMLMIRVVVSAVWTAAGVVGWYASCSTDMPLGDALRGCLASCSVVVLVVEVGSVSLAWLMANRLYGAIRARFGGPKASE